ncbi:MAG: ATP-binding protein, partial [Mucilaginibacter sp.]
NPPLFTIVAANKAYLETGGVILQDLEGKGFFDSFLKHRLQRDEKSYQVLVDSFNKVVSTRQQDLLPNLHVEVKDKKGNPKHRYLRIINAPLINEAGELTHIMHILMDISDAIKDVQKKQSAFEFADAQRRKAVQFEERLRLAIESAQLGTWYIELPDQKLTLSLRAKEILGLRPDDNPSVEDLIGQVREDYRQKSRDVLATAILNEEVINYELPVIGHYDKKLRWLKVTGKLYPDYGTNGRISGTAMDITEQKLDDIRKNDFISMVSHELKTPLTSMKAYVQMLMGKASKFAGKFILTSLQKVHNQVEKMRKIIIAFLDVARVQEGKMTLNIQRFDLPAMVKETVEENDVLATRHSVILDLCDSIFINADKEKLMQVLSNLLSNAIKYSPAGSPVKVSCGQKDNMAIVAVKDEGIGIPPKDIGQLFKRFYRVENNYTQNISGFGIGLYLCYEIIKRHNGNIWVESKPNKGSTFYFSVPCN